MPINESQAQHFTVSVDLVALTVRERELQVLLSRRGEGPHQGRLELPGAPVAEREDLPAAAGRALRDHAGLAPRAVHLEPLASYGAPNRDPRGRALSVAWLVLVPEATSTGSGPPRASRSGKAAAGSERTAQGEWLPGEWLPVDDVLARPRRLAFDHERIVRDGVERARARLEHTALGTVLCPHEFTVGEFRGVYEAVWGEDVDPRNFHRKVTGTPGLLEPLGRTTSRQGGRPAQLYRRGTATTLHPPLLRGAAEQ